MAYTPDRFDDVPEYTDQRGAHRDHFEGAAAAGAGARPWLLIVAAALLIGLGADPALRESDTVPEFAEKYGTPQ